MKKQYQHFFKGEESQQLLQLAELGDAISQYEVGQRFKNYAAHRTNALDIYKQAAYWYQKAAMQNHALAQYNLGLMYESGYKGVAKDDQQALYWYQKAASQNAIDAQNRLGVIYERGYGVQQDYQQAVQWYQKAANQNDIQAQYRLGMMYANGQGIKQDNKQALYWHEKVATQNPEWAQNILDEIEMYAKSREDKQSKLSVDFDWNASPRQWSIVAPCPYLVRMKVFSDGTIVTGRRRVQDRGSASAANFPPIQLWDPKTGQCLRKLGEESSNMAVRDFAILPDGTLASIVEIRKKDKPAIILWDLKTGQYLQTLELESKETFAITALPDGTFATCDKDEIKLWDLKKWIGKCLRTINDRNYSCLTALSDGTLVSGHDGGSAYGGEIKLWNPKTGQCLQTLNTGAKNNVNSLIVLVDGTLASIVQYHDIKLWNPKTGQCLQTLTGYSNKQILSLVDLPDGTLATSSYNESISDNIGTLELWDPKTGQHLKTLDYPRGYLALLPDGILACADTKNFYLYRFPHRKVQLASAANSNKEEKPINKGVYKELKTNLSKQKWKDLSLLEHIESHSLKQLSSVGHEPCYIPLQGAWQKHSAESFDLAQQLYRFTEGGRKVLLLLGDSGAGKSLFCQQWVKEYWRWYPANIYKNASAAYIPLFISLPGLKTPVNHLMEESLSHYGFSIDEIAQLKQNQRFLLILDGYDELNQLKNLYVTNRLEEWQVKVVITCRSQYLYHLDNYSLYFMPYRGEQAQGGLYSEVFVQPFQPKQIDAYLQAMVSHQPQNTWRDWQTYKMHLNSIPHLNQLIQTPFLLKLAVAVLPTLVERYEAQPLDSRLQLTQAALYDVFIEQWFSRQEKKLKANGRIAQEMDIKPACWSYMQALAQAMKAAGVNQISYESGSDLFGEPEETSPWAPFLEANDPQTALIQTACPLVKISEGTYALWHASLIDYFASRKMYQSLIGKEVDIAKIHSASQSAEVQVTQAKADEPLKVGKQEVPVSSYVQTALGLANKPRILATLAEAVPAQLLSEFINQQLFTREPHILQFLADRVQEDEQYKQQLFSLIEYSKQTDAIQTAAANAITILNLAQIAFSGMDLSNIKVPSADLSGAIMDHTRLNNANLQNVMLQGAWLGLADLSAAKMKDVKLGELPTLKLERDWASFPVCCYSRDGRWLAFVVDYTIHLYDAASLKFVRVLAGHTKIVQSIIFDLSGKYLVSGAWDKTVRLWEVETGKELQQFQYLNDVTCVALNSRTNYLAAGGRDGIWVWELKTNKLLQKLSQLRNVTSIAFHPNGLYLAATSALSIDTIYLWNVENGQEVRQFVGNTDFADGLIFDSSGRYLISGNKAAIVQLWDVNSGVELRQFKAHSIARTIDLDNQQGIVSAISCLALDSTEERLAATGKGGTWLWDLENGHQLQYFSEGARSVAFDPVRNRLILGIGKLWELRNSQISRLYAGHTDYVQNLAVNLNKQLVASGGDDGVRLWDANNGQTLSHFAGYEAVALDPQRRYVALGSHAEGSIQLCDTRNGKELWQVKHVQGHISRIAFCCDGNYVAAVSYNTLSEKRGNDFYLMSSLPEETNQEKYEHCFIFIEAYPLAESKLFYVATGNDHEEIPIQDIFRFKDTLTKIIEENTAKHLTYEEVQALIVPEIISEIGEEKASQIGCREIDVTIIQLWDVNTGKEYQQFTWQIDALNNTRPLFFFESTGLLLLSADRDNKVRLWDLYSGKMLRGFKYSSEIMSIAMQLHGSEKMITPTAWTGTIAVTSWEEEGVIRVFNVQRLDNDIVIGRTVQFRGIKSRCVIPDPSGQYLAIGNDNEEIDLVDLSTGKFWQKLIMPTVSWDNITWSKSAISEAIIVIDGRGIYCYQRSNETPQFVLQWRAVSAAGLFLKGANIEHASGLNQINHDLFKQYGAQGEADNTEATLYLTEGTDVDIIKNNVVLTTPHPFTTTNSSTNFFLLPQKGEQDRSDMTEASQPGANSAKSNFHENRTQPNINLLAKSMSTVTLEEVSPFIGIHNYLIKKYQEKIHGYKLRLDDFSQLLAKLYQQTNLTVIKEHLAGNSFKFKHTNPFKENRYSSHCVRLLALDQETTLKQEFTAYLDYLEKIAQENGTNSAKLAIEKHISETILFKVNSEYKDAAIKEANALYDNALYDFFEP